MITGIDMKVKTWSPAVPCKVSDNIVSSKFSSQKVFVPSYEKEKRPCIEQLLTNEYQRMWWQEKEDWDKRQSGKKVSSKKLLYRKIIKKKSPATITEKPKTLKKPRKKKETTTIKTDLKAKEAKQEEREVPEQVEEKIQPTEEKDSQRDKDKLKKQ